MTLRGASGFWRDLGCVLLLIAASAALFAPAFRPGWQFVSLSPAVVPPWRSDPPPGPPQDAAASDGLIWTWPNLHHWRRSVRDDWTGLLWDPGILCGSPFLATQDTFALYPSNLLSFAGDLPEFLLWTSLIHVAIANAGAFVALRRLAFSRVASLAGAWSFGGGSWFLAHLDVVNFPQAAAWLPWILFAADRAQVRRRALDRALLGVCVALSVLAGMIQITLISLLVGAIFIRARAELQARADGADAARRGLVSAGAGIALGLLLSAPQLVPLAEWSAESSRVRSGPDAIRRFAFRPLEWTHLLVPEILGSPAEISRWTGRTGRGTPDDRPLPPMSEQTYPPARMAGARGPGATFLESVCTPLSIGVLLALCALARPGRAGALFAALILGGALLAMDTPLMRAFASAPVGAFANPRRFLLLCTVGFAGLAAIGAQRVADRLPGRFSAALPAAITLAWLALNALLPDSVGQALLRATGDPVSRMIPPILAAQAAVPAAIFLLGAVLLIARVPPAWRVAGLAALAFGDSFLFNVRNNPCRPTEPIFPETGMTRFLAERVRDPLPPRDGIRVRYEDPARPWCRIARFRSEVPEVPAPLPPNVGLLFGLHDQQGYEGILPRRLEELIEAIQPGIVYEHHTVQEWPDPSVFTRPCFDLLGVRYLVSADDEIPNLFTVRQFPEELCSVFGNDGFVPRVSVVTRARAFDSSAALLAALAAPTFDPAAEVLILRPDAEKLGLPPPDRDGVIDLPPPAPGETLEWRQQACGRAAADATLAAPRLLIVTESFHAGWRAVDVAGTPLPSAPGNHAFQVYALPAGRTGFTVVFDPWTFRAGVAMAVCALLASIVDMILRVRVRRPPPHSHVQ